MFAAPEFLNPPYRVECLYDKNVEWNIQDQIKETRLRDN